MCFVWTVLYLRLCAVIGLTFSVDGTLLDPSMPNACAYRKLEMVRVSKPSRRARTQMVKIRTANCTNSQSECFEYKPRTVHYEAYERTMHHRFTTAYGYCDGWTRLNGESGYLHRLPNRADATQCLNGGRSRRHSRHFGEPHCICPAGYQGPRCESDVDECLSENRCTHDCVNTFGSFRCSCHPGYRLASDGASCSRRFGDRCERLCPDDCPSGRCHRRFGYCECPPASHGRFCNLPCTPFTFGPSCARACKCDQANSLRCDPVSGECVCQDGFTGSKCNHPCPKGTWGAKCAHRCNCSSCDSVTGECKLPAADCERSGECSRVCPEGFFGEGCAHRCNCRPWEPCDHVTGACRCQPGKEGPSCEHRCNDGWYGPGMFAAVQLSRRDPLSPRERRNACVVPASKENSATKVYNAAGLRGSEKPPYNV
ncbi:hypothetical protein HPB51_021233 [Rhipicephalus microplus]|uniref:EGF-like domain-containing protein n=1 Tax=Rhipicephalus microplus TaxID=6941 RepID=A0A9J6F8K0_RHIMP|nr:hypothetical protein HPB51_021233 [Rhipicephalus microplus]